ncbi:MAG: hypothetical protein ACYS30_03445 [Planctomycetota bacterium]|jgi:hypothetical protein
MMCKVRVQQIYCSVFVVFFIFFASRSAWATSTGLNNIPTTDIVPENILVFQTWGNFAGGEHPQQFLGFKYGPFKDVEIGVDWKANDKPHGHAMLQAKYAFDIKRDSLRGVIGIADLSDNRKHNGEYFPYAATSLDLKALRLHFGFAPQPHNERFFGGIDKTVSFLDRNLQLRFDGIHINDKEDMLFSAGFLYELAPRSGGDRTEKTGLARILDNIAKNIVLEAWVSKPSTGDKEVFTVKLNYVIRF